MRRRTVSDALTLLLEAISATALIVSFVVLSAWGNPRLQGAGSGYRYLSLGLATRSGISFSSLGSDNIVALQNLMPAGLGLATSLRERITISRKLMAANAIHTKVEFVVGRYSGALHLAPLCGRLITLQDQRSGASVAVLSRSMAAELFGRACSAVGSDIYTSTGFQLKVVGVISDRFKGLWAKFGGATAAVWAPYTLMMPVARGAWPKGLPTGDMFDEYVFSGTTAVLSVPDSTSKPQLATLLSQLFQKAKSELPGFAVGFATARPYSPEPRSQALLSHRIGLVFGLSLAGFILSSINMMLVSWLDYLNQRPTFRLERILGARRSHTMSRFAKTGLATMAVLGFVVVLFAMLSVVIVRHLIPSLSSVLNTTSLLTPLLKMVAVVALLAAIIRLLPLQILLPLKDVEATRHVFGSVGDRTFGSVLLASEIVLGAVLSILAAWAIAFGWRSTHDDIGVLDRPATIFSLESGSSLDLRHKRLTRTANILLMQGLAAEIRKTVGSAEFGIGPAFHRGGFILPGSVGYGARSTKGCGFWVTGGWLEANGVTVVAGNGFRQVNPEKGQILVDARLADELFGSPTAAIGRSVWTPAYSVSPQRIIGVTAPVYMNGLKDDLCPVIFYDLRNSPLHLIGNSHSLVVRSELSSRRRTFLRMRLTSLFEREHVGLAVGSIRSVTGTRDWLAARQLSESHVFSVIALLAWVVALSGIVALLRLYLAHRRRLVAIESALGATPRRTYLGVILGTLAIALVGATLSLLLLPWLATQYELLSGAQVSPFGWPTWIALAVLLLAVCAVAHFPARRAARAEPAESLHEL